MTVYTECPSTNRRRGDIVGIIFTSVDCDTTIGWDSTAIDDNLASLVDAFSFHTCCSISLKQLKNVVISIKQSTSQMLSYDSSKSCINSPKFKPGVLSSFTKATSPSPRNFQSSVKSQFLTIYSTNYSSEA